MKKINVTCFPNVFNLQSISLEHTRPICQFLVMKNDRIASLSEHDGNQELLITAQSDGKLIQRIVVPIKSIGLAYRRSDDKLFVQGEDGSLSEVDKDELKAASHEVAKFNATMLAEHRTVFFTEDSIKGVAIAA